MYFRAWIRAGDSPAGDNQGSKVGAGEARGAGSIKPGIPELGLGAGDKHNKVNHIIYATSRTRKLQ